jgi:hypothetical protein
MDQVYEMIYSKKGALQNLSCKVCGKNVSQISDDFLQMVDEKIESKLKYQKLNAIAQHCLDSKDICSTIKSKDWYTHQVNQK